MMLICILFFLSSSCFIFGQNAPSVPELWKQLLEERKYRQKLVQDVKNLMTELDYLKEGTDQSLVADEITVINEDITSLREQLNKVMKKLENGGNTNAQNGGNPAEIEALAGKVNQTIADLLTHKSQMKSELADVKAEQSSVSQNLSTIENEQKELATKVATDNKQLQSTISSVQKKQKGLTDKQNNFEAQLAGLKKEQDKIKTDLDRIRKSLSDLEKEQNNLKNINTDVINKQQSLQQNQSNVQQTQKNLKKAQDALVTKSANLDSKFRQLSSRQTVLDNTLANITDELKKMSNKVDDVTKTSGDLAAIISNQQNTGNQSAVAIQKELGDLRTEIYNSDCCKGSGSGNQNGEVKLLGRMFYATRNEVKSPVKWKGSYGNKFMALVPSTYKNYERDMTIMITTSKDGWYYVDNPYLGIKVNRTMSIGNNVYTIANDINVTPLKTQRNSFWIETSHDVTLYLMSTRSRSSDAYHVLPYKSLDSKYMVTTTEPYGRYYGYKKHYRSFISVGATHDNTKVAFRLNTLGYISYRQRRYHDDSTLEITLNQYETFEIQHIHDLTGTLITSSAPIAVLSGNQCNKLGSGSCSQLADMIPPIRSLSREYILPVVPDRPGTLVHVVATEDNTNVRIHSNVVQQGTTSSSQTLVTKILNAGQFYETTADMNTTLSVAASRAVLVGQAMNGTRTSDPMMLIVPGKTQFQGSYSFSVPAYNFKSRISVFVETRDLSGLRLDGKPVVVEPSDIRGITVEGTAWSLFALDITSGSHKMVQSSERPFGLVVYGDGHRDGFAYSAGMALKSG